MKAGFLEKLIERLGRIGPEEVQNYFLRLAQEKGFLETVFNAIQEGIIVTDSKGRITYLNDSACRLFGLHAGDAIGKRLDERVRGLDWLSLTQSGGPVSRDMEIFYPENHFINFYIVPLIIEHLETGEKIDKKAELQESIDIARAEVNRLDSIVTQFLRAIRPSKPQLNPENVNTIVEEAVRFFAPEIQDRDVVVEQRLRSDLPLLQIDRDQMKQAFYNVIKNSLEAMKRRGTLRIHTDMDDTHVLIRFIDTGSGMSAENLGRVFEPYFTTKPAGTGLGLLIVRRIVREHGGELSIQSSQGKGLTLTIRLPYIEKHVRMLEAGESKMQPQGTKIGRASCRER